VLYCGEEYTRTQYPEHLEKNHKDEYFRLIEKIKVILRVISVLKIQQLIMM